MTQRESSDRTERWMERLAHAFTPAEWQGRSLFVVSLVFVFVAAMSVVQRALVSDSATAWAVTAMHGLVIVVVVPVLIRKATRDWRAVQASTAVPE